MSIDNNSEANTINCPSCNTPNDAGARFCESCGANLSDGSKAKKATGKLGNLSENAHLKSIKTARTALIIVGVLTLIGGFFLDKMLQSEIASVRRNPNMIIDEAVVSQINLMIYAVYALGFIFFGLSFWAKKNPFAACLTGLIIYISAWLIDIASDPSMIMRGIIIKLIIISLLVNGVKAGIAWRQMQERGKA